MKRGKKPAKPARKPAKPAAKNPATARGPDGRFAPRPENRTGTGKAPPVGKGRPPSEHRFRPGQSGNPGGRPREIGYLRELARERTEEAIETLADVMLNGESDAARVAAATALLDRGYGKPPQSIAVDANVSDTRSVQIANAIADAHPELAEIVFGAAVAGRLVARPADAMPVDAAALPASEPDAR